jgi:glycerol uptake facilitator-like aquaporin
VDQVVRRCVPQDEFHFILTFVILILVVGILEQKEPPTRYLKVVFIGLLFLKMHIIFANHVKNAKK